MWPWHCHEIPKNIGFDLVLHVAIQWQGHKHVGMWLGKVPLWGAVVTIMGATTTWGTTNR